MATVNFPDTLVPRGVSADELAHLLPGSAENLLVGKECVVKEYIIPTGGKIIQHKHKYPHASALLLGSVRLSIEGEPSRILHAPMGLTIGAHLAHHIEAITDVVWLCIHHDNDEAKWIEP